jgi:hypothetical protein
MRFERLDDWSSMYYYNQFYGKKYPRPGQTHMRHMYKKNKNV